MSGYNIVKYLKDGMVRFCSGDKNVIMATNGSAIRRTPPYSQYMYIIQMTWHGDPSANVLFFQNTNHVQLFPIIIKFLAIVRVVTLYNNANMQGCL